MENKKHDKEIILHDCRRYIEAHLSEKIDPEALATYYGYAYSSFRRLFKKTCGYTIHNYIRLRRLHRAARVLRETGSIPEAIEVGGFETLSGFTKAFLEEFGVTSSEYAATRGRILMQEPQLVRKADFFVVGYAFEAEAERPERAEDCGAYWLGQSFPEVSREEYARIGGGADMVGLWSKPSGKNSYVIGAPVKRPNYIPQPMKSAWVPGGLFACFMVPECKRNQDLCESIRATWYFALRQWLPESGLEEDKSRLGYELYADRENRVYVPVKCPEEAKTKPEGRAVGRQKKKTAKNLKADR